MNIKPTPAERERLVKLLEEMAEVGQNACKALNHGYEAQSPDGTKYSNRAELEIEIGDVLAAIDLMVKNGDLDRAAIEARREKKSHTITKYMDYQE